MSKIGAIKIVQVDPAQTYQLRQKILRPSQTINDVRFSGDLEKDSAHYAVIDEAQPDQPLGIASVCREDYLPQGRRDYWRLRGVATLPEIRGYGQGAELVRNCLRHVQNNNGHVLWCTARTSVLDFYRKLDFEIFGDEYIDPISGPHWFMQNFLLLKRTDNL